MRLFVLVSEHHCSATLSLLFELIGPGAAIKETKQEPQDKRSMSAVWAQTSSLCIRCDVGNRKVADSMGSRRRWLLESLQKCSDWEEGTNARVSERLVSAVGNTLDLFCWVIQLVHELHGQSSSLTSKEAEVERKDQLGPNRKATLIWAACELHKRR